MKKLLFFVAVVAMCISCAAPKATTYSYAEYRTISPSQSVFTAPVYADLEVSPTRISYAERIEKDITTMTEAEVETMVSREKEIVIANAVRTNKADVLVAPIISVQTDVHHFVVIIVEGYPATYKNFRSATEADSWVLGQSKQQTANEKSDKPALPFAKILKK